MPQLLVNLRQLNDKNLKFEGTLSGVDLELEDIDELIHLPNPLSYNLEAQHVENAVLVQGRIHVTLDCECARCLKHFDYPVDFPDWVCHLSLVGVESAQVVNDCLDLTPYLREDILLAFPQNPVCKPDCGGLSQPGQNLKAKPGGSSQSTDASSAWAELNKLKFED